MNALVIMCGLPGSGKSTYAKKLLELHPDWHYVSRDEVRYEYVNDKEHYFDHEDEVYREFCNRIDMYLLTGETVIADATHLNMSSRNKLINNLSARGYEKIVVIMTTPFEECMKRNAAREGITRVPDQAMYNMKRSFKVPNPYTEDFNKILTVKG